MYYQKTYTFKIREISKILKTTLLPQITTHENIYTVGMLATSKMLNSDLLDLNSDGILILPFVEKMCAQTHVFKVHCIFFSVLTKTPQALQVLLQK